MQKRNRPFEVCKVKAAEASFARCSKKWTVNRRKPERSNKGYNYSICIKC